MSYTVLARKYRPQTFEELVGQEHVARTLANAIAAERVAHAFLFTGVRGVGKTTTARLLAKALNCESGPTAVPCNQCSACGAITAGNDMDVQEIDGASNNSVDDVRRLQETLPFRPARDRFKIVIVDEVHMLSTGAFNAFLKTLEEPPEHVKFIFATTESHKVPVTIRSRCQRYDFRLIPQRVIADRVRSILAAENITSDDETVAIVAREAAGSMRDALTLLDQLLALGGGTLVAEEVSKNLGIAGRKLVFDAARSVLEGDAAATLAAVHSLATQGADMLHFAKQLLELVRDLVVLSVAAGEGVVELVDEERELAEELVATCDPLELQRAFSVISKVVEEVGTSSSPRMALEMGLVRLATRPPMRSVQELMGRLTLLEQRVGGESAMSSASQIETGPARSTARSRDRSVSKARVRESSESASDDPPAALPAARSEARILPKPEPAQAVEEPAVSGEGPLAAWNEIVRVLQSSRPALGAVLEHGVPIEVTEHRLVIGFPKGSFFARQATTADAQQQLRAAAATVLGAEPRIEVVSDESIQGATLASADKERRQQMRERKRAQALQHPSVLHAMKVFPEATSSVEVHLSEENGACGFAEE